VKSVSSGESVIQTMSNVQFTQRLARTP